MNKDSIKYKLSLASQLQSEGKHLYAIQVLKSLMLESNDEHIYFQLAELYEDLGFIKSGQNILNDLQTIYPENLDVKLYIGQFLLRNSQWFDAIEILNEVSTSKPTAIFLIGYSYMMLNEFELASDYFRRFITSGDNGELKQEANLYLAKIEYELQNFDLALKYAENAKYIYSNFWELNLILAKVYYSLGMFTHAQKPIQKALKHSTKEPAILEFAGKIFFALEDYHKAEFYFSEYIEQSSEISAEIYTLLARSFLKQKKEKEAGLFFNLALQIDPEYLPAADGVKDLKNFSG